jgi:hypothetical protein
MPGRNPGLAGGSIPFDPLILAANLLSNHEQLSETVSVAILVGQPDPGPVFCGWICPLGTFRRLPAALFSPRPDQGYALRFRR